MVDNKLLKEEDEPMTEFEEELPELLKSFVIEKKEYYILLDVVWKDEHEGRDLEEIIRRLKAFDWYNKHYHLPDDLKHLEKGVSLKERKL